MSDFLRFCLNHGLGGLVLLTITAALTLLAALAVAASTMWLAGRFAEGFRKGWQRGDQT